MCLMFPLCPDLCKVLSMVNAHFSTPSQVTTHASQEQRDVWQCVVGASRLVNRQEVSRSESPPPTHTHAQNAAFCAPMSALLTRSRALVAGKPTTMISTCCAEPVDGSATQDAGVGRDSCRLSTPFPGPQALSAHVLCSFGRMQHAGMSQCSTCPPQMCVCACRPHACREPTRRRALCCCLEHALCACAPLSLHSCLCARAGHLAFE